MDQATISLNRTPLLTPPAVKEGASSHFRYFTFSKNFDRTQLGAALQRKFPAPIATVLTVTKIAPVAFIVLEKLSRALETVLNVSYDMLRAAYRAVFNRKFVLLNTQEPMKLPKPTPKDSPQRADDLTNSLELLERQKTPEKTEPVLVENKTLPEELVLVDAPSVEDKTASEELVLVDAPSIVEEAPQDTAVKDESVVVVDAPTDVLPQEEEATEVEEMTSQEDQRSVTDTLPNADPDVILYQEDVAPTEDRDDVAPTENRDSDIDIYEPLLLKEDLNKPETPDKTEPPAPSTLSRTLKFGAVTALTMATFYAVARYFNFKPDPDPVVPPPCDDTNKGICRLEINSLFGDGMCQAAPIVARHKEELSSTGIEQKDTSKVIDEDAIREELSQYLPTGDQTADTASEGLVPETQTVEKTPVQSLSEIDEDAIREELSQYLPTGDQTADTASEGLALETQTVEKTPVQSLSELVEEHTEERGSDADQKDVDVKNSDVQIPIQQPTVRPSDNKRPQVIESVQRAPRPVNIPFNNHRTPRPPKVTENPVPAPVPNTR